MATPVLIPIAEYLETSYRPDREYIDGEVLERKMGSWEHGRVQMLLAVWFVQNESNRGTVGAPEWRTRVAVTRIRIPDLVLAWNAPQTRVLATPPLLIVEILSPEDTYAETERLAADYQHMGVQTFGLSIPPPAPAKSAPETHGPRRRASRFQARLCTSSLKASSRKSANRSPTR